MRRSADDFAKEFVTEIADDAARHAEQIFLRLRARCQSPIEEVMAMALYYGICANSSDNTFLLSDFEFGQERPPVDMTAIIYSQATVGPYKADFLIDIIDKDNRRRFIVVECDGHDFHERTKKQAAKDRARDRWMMLRGIYVMRFTGSEIWADPTKCSGDVEEQFFRILGY